MGLGQILMPVRAWWFLRIAKNSIIPPEVGRYLTTLQGHNELAIREIEQKRQAIIDAGTTDGKTISTEVALKYVLDLKGTYDGPNREEFVREVDLFIDDFRNKHGTQIPVDQAYAMLKELEARFGQVG